MARPTKWRKIEQIPQIKNFIPTNVENIDNLGNVLLLEEIEAIRLKDLEGLEQVECANKMQVSRPTFQRILSSAREKIADSLINGKAISIRGGFYAQNIRRIRCMRCGKEYSERCEKASQFNENKYICHRCSSEKKQCCKHNSDKEN